MNNLRFAVRQLTKNPGFAVVAIVTLALGIGTCTVMFSVVNAVLLRPLPFREPEQLVWIENVFSGGGLSARTSRADTFLAWREQSRSFESLAAYFAFSDYTRLTLTDSRDPERLRSVAVSDNFLPTLGIIPLHGRNFSAEECRFNAPATLLLTHDYWLRRFGGDPNVVNRNISVNQKPCTIVGVLPRSFDFSGTFTPGSPVDVITPFPLTPETARYGNTVFGIGRLKEGATLDQAQKELTVISESLYDTIKGAGKFGAKVRTLDTALRGQFRTPFWILGAAVCCVLAIACVNLSNLLLARMNSRRQESAVRVVLGASRWHLIQQALTESLVLAVAGSAIAVPCAVWATGALSRMQTFGVPLLRNASIDPAALGITIGLTTLTGLACGLLPALAIALRSGSNPSSDATHQRSAGRSAVSARGVLVVTEVALACILLVGAGLLIRSFNAVMQVKLGFQPQQALAWRIEPSRSFKDGVEVDRYLAGLAQGVLAIPGVESVGFSDTLPLGRNRSWGAGAVGAKYADGQYPTAFPRLVDPNYFKALQIPLIAGRYLEERYDPKAEKSVVINENLARRLWPGQDPLGQKIRVNGSSTVVGVVANVRHSTLENDAGNEMYLDCRQCDDWSTLEMVVRTRRPAQTIATDVRTALTSFDRDLPTASFYPLQRLIDDAVGPRELITRLLGYFSALALILAAVGLYGVIAYSVSQRTQEIGIRMAIGAQREEILRLMLRGGLKFVLLGIVAGMLGSVALAGLMRSLVFGVSTHDPLVFVINAALLLLVAGAACLIPALRATRTDPMVALRVE
ncbi:MAG: ABC transporter permease [Verrucomicrobiales bacterium]|nr:ABC transporter permease [Verrucomicrobiales bacterium]